MTGSQKLLGKQNLKNLRNSNSLKDVRIPTTQNEERSVNTQASQVKPRKFLPQIEHDNSPRIFFFFFNQTCHNKGETITNYGSRWFSDKIIAGRKKSVLRKTKQNIDTLYYSQYLSFSENYKRYKELNNADKGYKILSKLTK